MTISDAQLDPRRAFVGGGAGVFVSALVWLAAALVERGQGVGPGFATLFFGGMAIFPVSALLARFLFRRKKESPDNPFGALALESTIAMIAGLFAAWLFLPVRPELVFPLSAIAVGTHYAVFRTVYGDRLFWLLGALITLIGLLAIYRAAWMGSGMIYTVAAVELLFAPILILRALRETRRAE